MLSTLARISCPIYRTHSLGNAAHNLGNAAHNLGNAAHNLGNAAHNLGNAAHNLGNAAGFGINSFRTDSVSYYICDVTINCNRCFNKKSL